MPEGFFGLGIDLRVARGTYLGSSFRTLVMGNFDYDPARLDMSNGWVAAPSSRRGVRRIARRRQPGPVLPAPRDLDARARADRGRRVCRRADPAGDSLAVGPAAAQFPRRAFPPTIR